MTAWGTLAAVAGAAAVADWVAVATGRRRLEVVAKPLTTLALLGVAATLPVTDPSRRAWLLVGLGWSLAGDVALLWPQRGFLLGLGAFLAAHLAYIVGFLVAGVSAAVGAPALAAVTSVSVVAGRRFLRALRADPGRRRLVAPVIAYMAAISAMVVTAAAAGPPVALAGAVAFYASDALIAEQRFVRARAWQPVAIMVTYHLGQAGLVAGLRG